MADVQPWMKFYPQDWRADEKLRMCSLAARGLWIEMLAIMHRSERYGQLLIGGRVPTDAQLAVQVGASPSEVSAMLADLKEAGVFSVTAKGVIYSRRMTRDHKKAEKARENGRNGGNPKLRSNDEKQRENKASVKGEDKAPDKGGLKPQKPEARSQKPELPPDPPLNPDLAAVMRAGRFVSPPPDAGLLRQWISDGADLSRDIVPVVERETESLIGRTGRGPFKLQVFDTAIRRKLADDAAQVGAWRRSGNAMRDALERQQEEDRRAAQEQAQFRRSATA